LLSILSFFLAFSLTKFSFFFIFSFIAIMDSLM
jgi:hypothetical protein